VSIVELQPVAQTVSGHNGVPINVFDYGGDGPPLILCHCTGTHARVWDPLVPALAECFHVYAVDTRGHGDSGKPDDLEAYTWIHCGYDLLAVIDAMELPTPLLAAGHSAGATQIAYAEKLRPGTFSRTVLIEPVIGPREAFQTPNPLAEAARRRRNIFQSRESARTRFASKPPMNTWAPETLAAYVNYGVNDRDDGRVELKCPGRIEAMVYEHGGGIDLFDQLGDLDMDVLLLAGSESNLRSLAELQRERFKNVEFRLIEGAQHFVPQERPDEIARIIRKRLRPPSA
jgi:pimeloyl-ACP methyl ester carboxylesterase